MKRTIRLRESEFRRMIKESVRRALNEMDLTNNQIRNITGITDDDELNTACMEEDADNLASNIVKDLRDEYGFYNIYDRGVVLDFAFLKKLGNYIPVDPKVATNNLYLLYYTEKEQPLLIAPLYMLCV